MIQLTPQMRILLAVEPVDFRRGIDGLARLCREVLKSDPFDGTVFVFRNRRATAIRLLVYVGQGFWLLYKRLFIGWSAETRRRDIRLVAFNSRYLISPWVEVSQLASRLLGRMARMLPRDWQRVYGHPVYFAETFVDPGRFRGTCYRAANWVELGWTTGRGKDDQTGKPNRPLKKVLGYPLTHRFRERLRAV